MKITFKLLILGAVIEDMCDCCIYLVDNVEIDKWGVTHNFRCVNAERIRASNNNKIYWNAEKRCTFFSPIGGIKKL